MALDDYFSDPFQDCLACLFDAVNTMDISAAPVLTRNENFVMRTSEGKEIFSQKFSQLTGIADNSQISTTNFNQTRHRPSNSTESASSFEDGIFIHSRDRDRNPLHTLRVSRTRTDSGLDHTKARVIRMFTPPTIGVSNALRFGARQLEDVNTQDLELEPMILMEVRPRDIRTQAQIIGLMEWAKDVQGDASALQTAASRLLQAKYHQSCFSTESRTIILYRSKLNTCSGLVPRWG